MHFHSFTKNTSLTLKYAVAMRKEDKELHEKINEGLKKLMASPKWEELKKKYDMQK